MQVFYSDEIDNSSWIVFLNAIMSAVCEELKENTLCLAFITEL